MTAASPQSVSHAGQQVPLAMMNETIQTEETKQREKANGLRMHQISTFSSSHARSDRRVHQRRCAAATATAPPSIWHGVWKNEENREATLACPRVAAVTIFIGDKLHWRKHGTSC